jgi:hypothetical protein
LLPANYGCCCCARSARQPDEYDGESSAIEDDDAADISLKSPVVRERTPPITRSAIKRKNAKRTAVSKKAPLSPAGQAPTRRQAEQRRQRQALSTKKASGSAGKSGSSASGAAGDDNDVVTEITSKALAYGLPIYHVKWQTGSTTWEFACDLNTEGYGSLLDRFEKSWGSRTVPVLSSDLWPRNNPADGVMAEKILDMGYCKNDTSVLVKWVGLPKEDATWERITDMMIYGFGDIVNKFRKDWGDKPIETVVLQSDTNNNNNNNNNTTTPATPTKSGLQRRCLRLRRFRHQCRPSRRQSRTRRLWSNRSRTRNNTKRRRWRACRAIEQRGHRVRHRRRAGNCRWHRRRRRAARRRARRRAAAATTRRTLKRPRARPFRRATVARRTRACRAPTPPARSTAATAH